jgi:cell wall-active antibiotic response 4TMS protein YvqF
MFCPKCGVEAGTTKFCRSCGTNLSVVSNVLEGGATPPGLIALGGRTTLNLFQSSSLTNEREMNGHSTVSVFGATKIDLTAAPVGLGETRINVISFFGGAEIIVPDDVAVRVSGISVFGSVKLSGRELSNGVFRVNEYQTPGYAQAARRLHVDATSIFSGVKIEK